MRAVLIVAGKGERLEPLTLTRQKCLIPIAGTSLIQHHLETLSTLGIREVALVVNYREKDVRAHVGNGSKYGLAIEYARQPRLDGTAHALGAAKGIVGGEDFLAIYGDLVISAGALKKLWRSFLKSKADAALAVTRVPDSKQFGVVEIRENHVGGIVEKPSRASKTALINAGVYCFKPEVFDYIAKTRPHQQRREYELTTSIQMMIDDDRKVIAGVIPPGEDWIDIGRPWDLLEANRRLMAHVKSLRRGVIEEGAQLLGRVVVAKKARVRSGSYIEGPCFIDEGADVGPNCYLRPATYIGRGARIGNAVEIKNSIVMDRVHIGHLSYVGDSILGEECNLGAGTITANLRLDDGNVKMKVRDEVVDSGRRKLGAVLGDGAKTGINVSLMPGVKLGPRAWVAAHLSVNRDVGAGEFLRD